MKIVKWFLIILLVILCIGVVVFSYLLNNHPSLTPYQSYFVTSLPYTPNTQQGKRLTATILGTSSVVISDGETSIMTDGFITRPSFIEMFTSELMPNKTLIADTLAQANIKGPAAVIPVHSHHDHSMDSPEVAMQTGALLVGSESTANIGRGWGITDTRISV